MIISLARPPVAASCSLRRAASWLRSVSIVSRSAFFAMSVATCSSSRVTLRLSRATAVMASLLRAATSCSSRVAVSPSLRKRVALCLACSASRSRVAARIFESSSSRVRLVRRAVRSDIWLARSLAACSCCARFACMMPARSSLASSAARNSPISSVSSSIFREKLRFCSPRR
ncbi:hypothetical protein D3C86_1719370 [compost metagenome]